MDDRKDVFVGWKVLIVDDDVHGLNIMSMLMQHHGAAVCTAENGRDGLEQALHMRPDFIISDLSMPVMDGWELIRRLKGERDTAAIPIIALTAHAMIGDREKAIAAGCHNYLTKPVNPIHFISHLYALLVDMPEFVHKFSKEE
ncbi:MAG: response regulator [Anaerolineae bacterium]|nr:response regulator [Anaerolineae bacterium]